MPTHTLDPLNPLLTPLSELQGTLDAPIEIKPAKRVRNPPKDKSHFEPFTTRTHYNGHLMTNLNRCQAYSYRTGEQCKGLANKKGGFKNCRSHGGIANKRTAEGEARRLEAVIKDNHYSEVEMKKRYKTNQVHKTLVKVAVAIGESNWENRTYPKPKLSELPSLLTRLEELESL